MFRDNFKTKVIFRKFKDNGSIVALFPEEIHNGHLIMSYQRVGQHGGADYYHCLTISKPAKPNEYQSLARELSQIGYNLDIKKKFVRKY